MNEQRAKVGRLLSTFAEDWAFHVRRGHPPAVLVTMADQSQALMIVVGAGQRGSTAALARMIAGSVVRSLFSQQRCPPVLVVPANRDER